MTPGTKGWAGKGVQVLLLLGRRERRGTRPAKGSGHRTDTQRMGAPTRPPPVRPAQLCTRPAPPSARPAPAPSPLNPCSSRPVCGPSLAPLLSPPGAEPSAESLSQRVTGPCEGAPVRLQWPQPGRSFPEGPLTDSVIRKMENKRREAGGAQDPAGETATAVTCHRPAHGRPERGVARGAVSAKSV